MKDIINIMMGELTTAVDNEVMKAVQKVGVDVNKEELLKALELYHNLVRCKECKHAHMTYDGLCKYCDTWKDDDGNLLELYLDGDYYCADGERKESE